MNKKGSIFESMELYVRFFIFIITAVIISLVGFLIYIGLSAQTEFQSPLIQAMLVSLLKYPVWFDWGFLFISVCIMGASLFAFYAMDMTLGQYVGSWIYVIVFLFVILVISGAIDLVISADAFSGVVSQMTFIPFFVANVQWFALLYIMLSLVAMHSPRS